MKQQWQLDLEKDEADDDIDSILVVVLAIFAALLCASAMGFVLKTIWPYAMAAIESWRFAP